MIFSISPVSFDDKISTLFSHFFHVKSAKIAMIFVLYVLQSTLKHNLSFVSHAHILQIIIKRSFHLFMKILPFVIYSTNINYYKFHDPLISKKFLQHYWKLLYCSRVAALSFFFTIEGKQADPKR